jgi:hypothetical protein
MQRDPIHSDANVTRVAVDPFSDEFLADPFAFHPQLRDALLSAMRKKISRITAPGQPVSRLNNTLCSFASLPIKIEQ